MLSEPISMLGPDFVKFAESQAKIWSMAQGAEIQHENFGTGEIEAVQIRKGYVPLITIKFCTNSKVATFNSDAFKSGKITKVKVPPSLLEPLVAWKNQLAINAAHEAKVATEKLRLRELEALASAEWAEDLATRINNPPLNLDIDFPSGLESQERYAAAKRAHYASALPARIRWLNKWSERIQSGATGLEPAWSRGKAVTDYLRDQGIDHLWHFTDIRNLKGIHREGGLLSWTGVSAREIADAYMVADNISRSCDERLGREHYVRLSFVLRICRNFLHLCLWSLRVGRQLRHANSAMPCFVCNLRPGVLMWRGACLDIPAGVTSRNRAQQIQNLEDLSVFVSCGAKHSTSIN